MGYDRRSEGSLMTEGIRERGRMEEGVVEEQSGRKEELMGTRGKEDEREWRG